MTTTAATGTTTQVYQLYIHATEEEVWRAVTDPATVARFFHGQVREATYEVGGHLRSWSPDRSRLWGDNVFAQDCCERARVVLHPEQPEECPRDR